jgi:hypothetical protein
VRSRSRERVGPHPEPDDRFDTVRNGTPGLRRTHRAGSGSLCVGWSEGSGVFVGGNGSSGALVGSSIGSIWMVRLGLPMFMSPLLLSQDVTTASWSSPSSTMHRRIAVSKGEREGDERRSERARPAQGSAGRRGARGESRTPTPFRAPDPKSGASAVPPLSLLEAINSVVAASSEEPPVVGRMHQRQLDARRRAANPHRRSAVRARAASIAFAASIGSTGLMRYSSAPASNPSWRSCSVAFAVRNASSNPPSPSSAVEMSWKPRSRKSLSSMKSRMSGSSSTRRTHSCSALSVKPRPPSLAPFVAAICAYPRDSSMPDARGCRRARRDERR